MTQEEKELVLKDLCARLPYNVKINVGNDTLFIPRLKYIDGLTCHFWECSWTKFIDEIKPYLRSISNLTEEERFQLGRLLGAASYKILKGDYSYLKELLEYVYKNHIDLFGLVPKGLALEAPEGMYKS